MTENNESTASLTAPRHTRRSWVTPTILALPPLVALTLQTTPAINGSGSSGGVVFSVLTGRGIKLG